MNKGIIIKGNGKFFGNNTVAGDNAKIINNQNSSTSKDEIVQRLDELNHMLMNSRDDIANIMALIEDVIIIKEEINKKEPDKSKIESRINKLDSSVSSIASIASALNTIRDSISNIL